MYSNVLSGYRHLNESGYRQRPAFALHTPANNMWGFRGLRSLPPCPHTDSNAHLTITACLVATCTTAHSSLGRRPFQICLPPRPPRHLLTRNVASPRFHPTSCRLMRPSTQFIHSKRLNEAPFPGVWGSRGHLHRPTRGSTTAHQRIQVPANTSNLAARVQKSG